MVNRAGPRFYGDVCVEFLPDGRKVCLKQTLRFRDSKGHYWYAPAGLVCDGATIPSIAWPVIGGPFEGLHRDAAIMHDAAYAAQGRMTTSDGIRMRTFTRADADRMMNEAMIARGVPFWKRRTIYAAVRMFGGFAWRKDAS